MKKIIIGMFLTLVTLMMMSAITMDGPYSNDHRKIIIRQKKFIITTDYNKSLKYLKCGYILQDVDFVYESGYPRTVKYYTLIKY